MLPLSVWNLSQNKWTTMTLRLIKCLFHVKIRFRTASLSSSYLSISSSRLTCVEMYCSSIISKLCILKSLLLYCCFHVNHVQRHLSLVTTNEVSRHWRLAREILIQCQCEVTEVTFVNTLVNEKKRSKATAILQECNIKTYFLDKLQFKVQSRWMGI